MNLSLLNSLCYTVGWFWCVLCGVYDYSILAAIGTFFLIFTQLYCARLNNLSLYVQDAILAIFSLPLGLVLETFFIYIGLIDYANHAKMLPPIWIICLYPLFFLLFNHSLRIIKKSSFLAFLFGFLGAPLNYMAGHSLGGLSFSYSFILTWAVLGISWGLFLCLMIKIANSVEKATAETFEDCDSARVLELLYDGDCPICKKEICFLQNRARSKNIKFINIASKEFLQGGHGNIDYETAMKQIYAIDGRGNLLVGLAAFAATYARCQLFLASTLLRLPFIKTVLTPFYAFFARKRLWITGRKMTNLKK